MLRIAVPNKGSLSEGALSILKEAGYRCKRSGRELVVYDRENDIEFVYLRPRDIAVYVGNGTLDLGITGRDLAIDSESPVDELLKLNFGRSRFFYAAPKGSGLTPDMLGGKRIATSYATVVRQDMASRGLSVGIVRLDGAVEISVQLGVADVIADVVESGRTLVEAGLETIGEPIMTSEAVVVAGKGRDSAHCERTQRVLRRMEGILMARSHAMVEYDVPREALGQACGVTPGIESPTIAPLSREGWVAVKSMILRKDVQTIMEKLSDLGAKGIFVSDIRTCRL